NTRKESVLLTSDAYVKDVQTLVQLSQRALIGDPVDFRAIQTSVKETAQYTNITGRDKKRVSSRAGFTSLLQLIPRGSVFYLDKTSWTAFKDCLQKDNPSWTQIGYNQYQIIH
ncbi:MAG: hypothetical protein AAFP00_18425, partial [Bacteroidota bacterium]